MRRKYKQLESRQSTKIISIFILTFLICATAINAQRTDHEETHTSYSDMSEYTIRFYDVIGNDSIYIFDSDQYGTHVMVLNGTDGSVTFYGNITMMRNLTMNEFTVAGFVKNDASGLLSGGNSIDISDDTNLGGTAPIIIVGDDVTITQAGVASDGYLSSADWINFNTAYGWGDHSGLYSLLNHIHNFNYSGYNQDLNTTNAVTFTTIDTGQGANELYGMDQNVLTSSDVEFENVTVDNQIVMSNGGITWNIYVNATGVLVWEMV